MQKLLHLRGWIYNLWKNERKNQQNKTLFDKDFLSAYNAQVLYPEIYAKLGKISIGTLQRWKRILGNSNNYELLTGIMRQAGLKPCYHCV